MKKKIYLSLIFVLIMQILLVSCTSDISSEEKPPSQSGEGLEALPRYVEYNINPPGMKGSPLFMRHGHDGAIELVCVRGYDRRSFLNGAAWFYYESGDDGKSWQEKDISWAGEYRFSSDEYYEYLKSRPEEGEGSYRKNIKMLMPDGRGRLLACMENVMEGGFSYDSLCVFTQDGAMEELPIPLAATQPSIESYTDIASVAILPNGSVYLRYQLRSVDLLREVDQRSDKSAIISLEDGSCIYSGDSSGFYSDYCFGDEYVLEIDNESIREINIYDGSVRENADYPVSTARAMPGSVTLGGGKIHIFSNGKITAYDVESKEEEILAHSQYFSFSTDINVVKGVCPCPGGEYLLMCDSQLGSGKLLRYVYEEDAPPMDGGSLSVFSIKQQESLKLAIYEMGLLYPGIDISYEFIYDINGFKADYTMTADDSIKRLNAALLAGSGPDIIILDGLQAKAYAENGVLENLAPHISREKFFPSVYNHFYNEAGELYMAPCRVAVPVMLCPGGEEENYSSYEAMKSSLPLFSKEKPFAAFFNFDEMLEYFTSLYMPAIIVNGEIDRDAVRDYLQGARAMDLACSYNIETRQWSKRGAVAYFPDNLQSFKVFSTSLMRFSVGEAKTGHNTATGLSDYLNIYLVGEMGHSNYAEKVFERDSAIGVNAPSPAGAVFYPKVVAGVNANAENKAQAIEFVKLLLSDGVQSYEIREGLPVNTAAFENSAAALLDKVFIKNDGYEIDFNKIMNSLETPSMPNEYVYNAVYESGAKYCRGEYSLDEAVEDIINNTELYLGEINGSAVS